MSWLRRLWDGWCKGLDWVTDRLTLVYSYLFLTLPGGNWRLVPLFLAWLGSLTLYLRVQGIVGHAHPWAIPLFWLGAWVHGGVHGKVSGFLLLQSRLRKETQGEDR